MKSPTRSQQNQFQAWLKKLVGFLAWCHRAERKRTAVLHSCSVWDHSLANLCDPNSQLLPQVAPGTGTPKFFTGENPHPKFPSQAKGREVVAANGQESAMDEVKPCRETVETWRHDSPLPNRWEEHPQIEVEEDTQTLATQVY